MGFHLSQDDLEAGIFVAITRGPTDVRIIPHASGVELVPSENSESNGLPIYLLGVSRPFAFGRFVHTGRPIVLDSRTVELTKLDESYVEAIRSQCAGQCGGQAGPLVAEIVQS